MRQNKLVEELLPLSFDGEILVEGGVENFRKMRDVHAVALLLNTRLLCGVRHAAASIPLFTGICNTNLHVSAFCCCDVHLEGWP